MIGQFIRKFIAVEGFSGYLLMVAAAVAMILANSPLQEYYSAFFSHKLLFFINDGLMVLFFMLIGMEIKREFVVGELSSRAQAMLPAIAALGGMIAPMLIYAFFNHANTDTMRGLAIPSATDIAFSLCVLGLCGRGVPAALKVFLMALAVIDDLGAIILIAVFYTAELHLLWLGVAVLLLALLFVLNRKMPDCRIGFIALGVLLWLCVLLSGVHATIAGVLLGLTIPLRPKQGESLLLRWEHKLHPYVNYFILPLFALANAGIVMSDMSWADLQGPISLGITLGLFLGKQVGIICAVAFCVFLGMAKKPHGASWPQLYGVALLAGIGFTMSLFIGGLAFGDSHHFAEAKLGVILGSLISAIAGGCLLKKTSAPNHRPS